jgi:hypothetical protein
MIAAIGEMSRGQDARNLSHVAHADEAEEVFSTLMGDLVEPRRDFIQSSAVKIANLAVQQRHTSCQLTTSQNLHILETEVDAQVSASEQGNRGGTASC